MEPSTKIIGMNTRQNIRSIIRPILFQEISYVSEYKNYAKLALMDDLRKRCRCRLSTHSRRLFTHALTYGKYHIHLL